MNYITKDEITSLITLNVLDDITDDNDSLLNMAESVSLSELDSYIGHKYKLDEEWLQTGNDRNLFLVSTIIDIMLYHLHSRLTPSNIPQVRFDRYSKAVSWMDDVAKGKLTPNLSPKDKDFDTRSSESLFGFSPKVNDYTF